MIVTIIIPVYNERRSFSRLLDMVLASDTGPFNKEIIVVDDASTDGFPDLLPEQRAGHDIRMIRHAANAGKAASIRTALTSATGDIVLIQDGDLEYSPGDYAALLSPFSDPLVDAVYGSRFLTRSWPSRMRTVNWVANKIFTNLVNMLYRARLTDEGTAYKVFRRTTLDTIAIESSGFEFCPEVTVKLLTRKARIVEVPIAYTARSKGEGKKPNVLDGVMILWTIIRYRFRRPHSRAIQPLVNR
jgi:glycosyltransferase involved in cell wall biosynthesis